VDVMKKFLLALALVLVPSIAAAQGAGHLPKELGGNLRYTQDQQLAYLINTATTAETAGTRGAVLSLALSTATTYDTTTVGRFPYGAILRYVILESGDDTATCSSLIIDGIGIDGSDVQDVRTNLSETAAYGSRVFSRVTRVRASGCTANLDSGDTLTIVASVRVGLKYPIRVVGDVDSICASRGITATVRCQPLSQCTVSLSGRLTHDYVDLSTCVITGMGAAGALVADDQVTIRYRASPN
jgi:hypothetical protein